MKILFLINLLIICSLSAKEPNFPAHWWKKVPKNELKWWEIGPSAAKSGEVVLSKRNELGILSNFADTPFKFRGKTYKTIEGLWQSMKYPEGPKDPRFKAIVWKYSRAEVEQMQGFDAKKAGDLGSKVMKQLGIDWVSFEGKRFEYKTSKKGEHYKIIRKAMMAKLNQNPKVKKVLLSTGDLILRADHHTKITDPPAWKYYDIWMEIREAVK